MIFYSIVATVATVLYHLGIESHRKKEAELSILFFSMYVLVPSIIGGARDLNIGTDMDTYVVKFYNWISAANNLYNALNVVGEKEYGYYLLNYLSSAVYDDIHFFLFVVEAIKITLIGITAFHFRKKCEPALIVLPYFLFSWWYGLSMMRQSLAIAICFLAFVKYTNRQYFHFIILTLIAYTFHNSSIFILLLPLINIFVKRQIHILVNLLIIVILYLGANTLVTTISTIGIVSKEMTDRYIDTGVDSAKSNLLITTIFLMYSLYRYYICNLHIKKGLKEKSKALRKQLVLMYMNTSLCAYSIFFLLMAKYFEVAYRVSYYPMIGIMIITPIIIKADKKYFREASVIYIMLYAFYYYLESRHGLADTIPYRSEILGI